ncbi:MAG TPA: ABC transporter permease [Vicinamibacterales bacterium]|nr:ABC transporter permease [Vicinamibacterales bacterium]
MRFLAASIWKDLRRRLADPAAQLVWIGLPIVFGGLMSLVIDDGGPAPKAHVLVVDEDRTLLSGLVTGAGRQGQLGQFLEIETVPALDGHARIQAGKASALLMIPKGFQDGVLREQPTELTLVTNPAQRILPRIIEEGLRMAIEAAFYLQRIFGASIRDIVAGGVSTPGFPTDDRVAGISRRINQNLQQLQGTLVPPVITVETRTEASPTANFQFGPMFMPGLLFMSLLLVSQSISADIWIEKEKGTLRRAMSTPQRLHVLLAAKIAGAAALMLLVAIVAVVIGVVAFDVAPARVPGTIAWAAFAGTALLCYFLFLQMLGTSQRGANLLTTMVVFPMMMVGGSFFPFEIMPPGMAAVGRSLPNGMAVTQTRALMFGQPEPGALLIATLVIGGLALAAFLGSVSRLRGRFLIS